jgi:hypothetical protein
MIPLEELLWEDPLQHVKEIGCFQPCGPNGKPQILGFRLQDPEGGPITKTYFGQTTRVAFQHPDWPAGPLSLSDVRQEVSDIHYDKYPDGDPRRGDLWFDASKTLTLDVDRGEVITEVQVDYPHYRSIKLVSSLGQEVVFGEDIGDNAYHGVNKSDDGEKLLGICIAFGKLDGWTEERKKFSHWGLSQVVVISGKIDAKG